MAIELRAPIGRQNGVAWARDGILLATMGTRGIGIWLASSGRLLEFIETSHPPNSGLTFSPDGSRVAAVIDDGRVHLWRCEGGQEIPVHSDPIFRRGVVAWSPSRELLAASEEGSFALRDCYSGKPQTSVPITSETSCIAWSPDGCNLAVGGRTPTIVIWRLSPSGLWFRVTGPNSNVRALAWSPDGKSFTSGYEDGLLCIWNVEQQKIGQFLDAHKGPICGLDYSRNGVMIASKSVDGSLRILDAQSGKEISTFTETADVGATQSVAFSPGKDLLASADFAQGVVRIREISSKLEERLAQEPRKVRIFLSYSHTDTALKESLLKHLQPLRHEGLVQSWNDRLISAGSEWADEIDQNLEEADIILLLISASFLSSEYCYSLEMKTALRRHEEGTAIVVPIILRAVEWEKCPFSKLQAVPSRNGRIKPVAQWSARDEALKVVASEIRRVSERLVRSMAAGAS